MDELTGGGYPSHKSQTGTLLSWVIYMCLVCNLCSKHSHKSQTEADGGLYFGPELYIVFSKQMDYTFQICHSDLFLY